MCKRNLNKYLTNALFSVNWCQFWFEYYPLPPLNVLGIIENMLLEHDSELLHHLTRYNVSSKMYAWPLLQTAFSEILTSSAWKVFWDHVLTNESSFLLCAVVACNILQRTALLNLSDSQQFENFYFTHAPIEVRNLIRKSYCILNNTSKEHHPRQYLNMFKKIDPGKYPQFCNYPKTIVNMKEEKENAAKEELQQMQIEEIDLIKKRRFNFDKCKEAELEELENDRILGK